MASVQDVFAQMQAEQTEVLSDETFIPDPNEYCVLESDATRRILIPQKYAVFGVESDEKTNRIKFAFPKAVNDIQDLSQYNLRFNYIDAKGNTDQITARNMQVQGDYVLFDWILTRNVTRYQGNISFIVCAVTVKEDGVISNEWNTTVATAQSLEGIETEPTPGEEQIARDLLTELLVSLNNSKNNAITEITQTKTQAISDVQAEGQTQTEAVDAKGAQVLESIPDDYITLENRVDELEQNRAYVIVGNGSGEFVTLNDSSELRTRNVKLFGKSVQKPTKGYNLFDLKHFADLVNEHTEESGITVEILDYATGTFKIKVEEDKKSGSYRYSFKLKDFSADNIDYGVGGGVYSYAVGDRSNNMIAVYSQDVYKQLFTNNWIENLTGEEIVIIYRDINEVILSNAFIAQNNTNQVYLKENYEVFTNGQPQENPTPDYPLPITSAGNYNAESEKYEIGILVANKNFASNVNVYSGYYNDSNGLIVSSDSRFIRVSKIKIIPGVKYRISSNLELYTIWSYDVNDNPIRMIRYSGSYTNLLNATDKEVYIGITLHNTSGQADTTDFEFIQVEVGEEQTSYIDGKSQNTTLQIPNPLRGIPVNSEGNYTDADGQQWICDYIDRERGKYVQILQSLNFVGSPNFAKSSSPVGEFEWYGAFNKASKTSNWRSMSSFAEYSSSKKAGCFAVTGTALFYTPKEEITVAEVNELFQSMIDSRSVYIISQLPEPIETSLTQEQLSALNLSTYQGITNIGTDTMPQVGIDVEYIADTKTYIDNAIAEAIAAIPTE